MLKTRTRSESTKRFGPGLTVRRFATVLFGTMLGLGVAGQSVAQPVAKRWFPGHYLYVTDDLNHKGMRDDRRNLVRNNPNFVGYKNLYWWHTMEPKKGVYDFSMILADLDKAQADGKKVIIALMERSFHASRPFPVPAYIRDEYNGTWTDDGKTFIKAWEPAVAERYFLLLEALARAVDDHPAFQMFFTEESGMSNVHLQAGYSHAKMAQYWKNLSARGAAAFKHGIFAMNFNWGLASNAVPSRQEVTDGIVRNHANGIGASDLRLNGSTGTLETSFGYIFERYAGAAPLHASVEHNTYAMGWTAKQLLDFGVDRLKLNFIAWMVRNDTSGVTFNIHDAIDEVNRQGGRINKTPPTSIVVKTAPEAGSSVSVVTGNLKRPAPPRNLRALR